MVFHFCFLLFVVVQLNLETEAVIKSNFIVPVVAYTRNYLVVHFQFRTRYSILILYPKDD